jgi:hypothetical protein
LRWLACCTLAEILPYGNRGGAIELALRHKHGSQRAPRDCDKPYTNVVPLQIGGVEYFYSFLNCQAQPKLLQAMDARTLLEWLSTTRLRITEDASPLTPGRRPGVA